MTSGYSNNEQVNEAVVPLGARMPCEAPAPTITGKVERLTALFAQGAA